MYIYIYIYIMKRTNDNCQVGWKWESNSILELSLCQKYQLSNKLGWLTF